jgi:hypothetical protein
MGSAAALDPPLAFRSQENVREDRHKLTPDDRQVTASPSSSKPLLLSDARNS